METYLWWAVAGIALIVIELVTGTFYLLVIGIAALAASVSSYLGHSFAIQAVIATAVAVIGVVIVTRFRASSRLCLRAPRSTSGKASCSIRGSAKRIASHGCAIAMRCGTRQVIDAGAVDAGRVLYIQRVDREYVACLSDQTRIAGACASLPGARPICKTANGDTHDRQTDRSHRPDRRPDCARQGGVCGAVLHHRARHRARDRVDQVVPQQSAWVVERLGKFHACSSRG